MIGERLCEIDRVDTAGGSARQNVHDEARADRTVSSVGLVAVCCRCSLSTEQSPESTVDFFGAAEFFVCEMRMASIRDAVEFRCGGTDKPEQFLGYSVNVNRQRRAAVHDNRKPDFLIEINGRFGGAWRRKRGHSLSPK